MGKLVGVSIPRRLWNILRSEVNHRLGRFDTPEHRAFRAAWERAQREAESVWEDIENAAKEGASGSDAHYQTLGLAPGSSFTEVRAAYKRLVKEHHPDNFQDAAEVRAATLRFQEINAAYAALKAQQ